MTVKKLDVCGIGCALLDIEVRVDADFLAKRNLKKGSMTLVDAEEQKKIFSELAGKEKHDSSGGSAANTIAALALLGKKVSYIHHTADDMHGGSYRKDLKSLGILLPRPAVSGGRTGTCLVLIDEEGERTMLTHLGCAGTVSLDEHSLQHIAEARILYLEGYLLETQAGQDSVVKAISHAQKNKTKIALSASDFTTVQRQKKHFMHLLKHTDILFANSDEMQVLAEAENNNSHDNPQNILKTARQFLKSSQFKTPNNDFLLALTQGARGATIFYQGDEYYIPAKKTKVIDLTGAGDAFAAGILKELSKDTQVAIDIDTMGSFASEMASTVIARYGARYS